MQDGDQDDDSGGSAVRRPVKKHEGRLYDLYRAKWWVQSQTSDLYAYTNVIK